MTDQQQTPGPPKRKDRIGTKGNPEAGDENAVAESFPPSDPSADTQPPRSEAQRKNSDKKS